MNARLRPSRPVLDPFYYLNNFESVLAAIRDRYVDLLSPEEASFLERFFQAPTCARALLARMVMRQGVLFRSSKLNYPEIGDIRVASAPLIAARWVDDRPMLAVGELHTLANKCELIRWLGLPRRYGAWKRPALISMLLGEFKQARSFDEWSRSGEIVYALTVAPLCERFRIMYFGNARQSWSEFVTADLKIFNYEKREHSLHSRAFQTREQVDVFQRLQACAQLLREGAPPEEWRTQIPACIADSDWLESKRQKLLYGIAREYELAGTIEAARALYRDCTHRGARVRAIRIATRMHDWPAVRALCLQALEQPESEAELQHVRRVIPRANRKLRVEDAPAFSAAVVPEFEIVLMQGDLGGGVEFRVRDHLAQGAGARSTVRYVENGLINALFGLLCWEAIFAPIAGAFFHDFHHAPADLASGQFYRRRQREFQACFSQLASGHYRQTIWSNFQQKWGIQSPFVRWQSVNKSLLRCALDCIPAQHLRIWFDWMVRDIPENCAGFPDLIQFWPDERRYRMIEVKGPGDRLQDNQRRFLEHCVMHAIPVSVCHVRCVPASPALALEL